MQRVGDGTAANVRFSGEKSLSDSIDSRVISNFLPDGTNTLRITEDLYLIAMRHGENVCFKGRVAVCAVQGRVSVLGSVLSPAKRLFHPCYSPSSHSLLVLDALFTPVPDRIAPITEVGRDAVGVSWRRFVETHADFDTILALQSMAWDGLDELDVEQPSGKLFTAPVDYMPSLIDIAGFFPVRLDHLRSRC
jgi:hypothetical protein